MARAIESSVTGDSKYSCGVHCRIIRISPLLVTHPQLVRISFRISCICTKHLICSKNYENFYTLLVRVDARVNDLVSFGFHLILFTETKLAAAALIVKDSSVATFAFGAVREIFAHSVRLIIAGRSALDPCS